MKTFIKLFFFSFLSVSVQARSTIGASNVFPNEIIPKGDKTGLHKAPKNKSLGILIDGNSCEVTASSSYKVEIIFYDLNGNCIYHEYIYTNQPFYVSKEIIQNCYCATIKVNSFCYSIFL